MLQEFKKIELEIPKSAERVLQKDECKTSLIFSENADFGIFSPEIKKNSNVNVFCPKIEQKKRQVHYYSFGNFSVMNLIFYYLDQIGSAEVLMSTYSISHNALMACISKREKGTLKNIRFIVDNRVRSLSPKPFDIMAKNFEYRCTAIHAKVALIWNENFNISIVTSQNATSNPKTERGTIFFEKEVFDFDKKIMENIYERGTT